MATNAEISASLFDDPSGSVRGIVTAFMPIKGRQKRIAHATLMVDQAPSIALELPKSLALDEIEAAAANLQAFAAKVRELA